MNQDTTTPTRDQSGFTLIEMVVAILILTVTVLGIGASTAQVMQAAADAGIKAEALQAVEGRISLISMDPRWGVLDSLYGGEESDLPGLEGYTRATKVTVVSAQGESGRTVDYKRIMVSVSGPGLNTITRTIIMGQP